MTWKQANTEALQLVEQAALNRAELHLTDIRVRIATWLIIQRTER